MRGIRTRLTALTFGLLALADTGMRSNRRRMFSLRVALFGGGLLASFAFAAPGEAIIIIGNKNVDWSEAFLFRTTEGVTNPFVWVGFNPQPEPPLNTFVDLNDPSTLRLTVPGASNPQTFQILFAMDLADGFVGSDRPDAFGNFTFVPPIDDGAPGFVVRLDLTTSSGGVADSFSWGAFNPQPEPPLFPAGSGIVFEFEFDSLSDAFLDVQITEGGQALSFGQVPEPSSMLLIGSGLLGLASRRRNPKPLEDFSC